MTFRSTSLLTHQSTTRIWQVQRSIECQRLRLRATRVGLLGITLVDLACAGSRGTGATVTEPKDVRFCTSFQVNQRGPLCLRTLTAEEVRKRNHSWKLTYDGQNAVEAVAQNGLGHAHKNDYGGVRFQYIYSRNHLTEIRSFDRFNNLLERTRYSKDWTNVDYVDEWGRPSLHGSSYYIKEIRSLDANGFVAETQYFGLDGKPAKSEQGAYGARYVRDANGLASRVCYVDSARAPMLSRWNLHCVEYVRDDYGNVVEERFLDRQMLPTENIIGRHRSRSSFDKYGNLVAVAWYALDDLPYRWTHIPGHCSTVVHHVLGGALVGGDCLDERSAPARFVEGNTYWRSIVDSTGRVTESTWLGPDGAPQPSPRAARVILKFGKNDFVTERQFFLGDRRPGQTNGPDIIRYEPDEHGLVRLESYFDATKQQTYFAGCAYRQFEYDGHRQLVSSTCMDAQRRPTRDLTGVFLQRYTYHPNGLLAETNFFDVDGKPTECRDGFSKLIVRYDSQGTETGRSFYDLRQQLVPLLRLRAVCARSHYATANRAAIEREMVVSRLEEARKRMIAGDDFESVALRFDDEPASIKNPGVLGYFNLASVRPIARQALEPLRVGELSTLIEFPEAICLCQRLE